MLRRCANNHSGLESAPSTIVGPVSPCAVPKADKLGYVLKYLFCSSTRQRAAANSLMITTVNSPGLTGWGPPECVHLPSSNQVHVPLPKLRLQQNPSPIKRFSNCSCLVHPLPRENMQLPNSVTHLSLAHQQHNCGANWHAKAANWEWE